MALTGDGNLYLIWSHEHGAWWGPGGRGYTNRLPQAGRYSRAMALSICAEAMPGTADGMGALPELPVRLADVEEFVNADRVRFPWVSRPWLTDQ